MSKTHKDNLLARIDRAFETLDAAFAEVFPDAVTVDSHPETPIDKSTDAYLSVVRSLQGWKKVQGAQNYNALEEHSLNNTRHTAYGLASVIQNIIRDGDYNDTPQDWAKIVRGAYTFYDARIDSDKTRSEIAILSELYATLLNAKQVYNAISGQPDNERDEDRSKRA